MFILYANKNRLIVRQREPVTSGSKNVSSVRFEFSAEWEGLARTAIFRAGTESRAVLLGEDNETAIPWEVLRQSDLELFCGVYGTQGGHTVLPTIWASLDVILAGASPGEPAQPPTPDLWQQELARKGDGLRYDGLNLSLLSGDNPLATVQVTGGGAGESVTAGDGLSKDGHILSVDNPVRGILTQAEFDALPESEKSKGTYFVDDGQTGGSGQEVYDEQERIIGTWFGRRLYRKVLVGTMSRSASSLKFEFDEDLENVRINGFCRIAAPGYYDYPLNVYENSTVYAITYYQMNGKSIVFKPSDGLKNLLIDGENVVVVAEYTKVDNSEVVA